MTPFAAWDQHRKRFQERFPEDYAFEFGDRHICPDYFWVFNFYRKWITDKLGSYKGLYVYIKIVEFVKSYNETTNTNNHAEGSVSCAKFAQTIDGEKCIAISDPLKRRVHILIP